MLPSIISQVKISAVNLVTIQYPSTHEDRAR